MSEQNAGGFVNQVGRGLGGLFKFLVRLIFVLVLAVALGAGIYFGVVRGIPALDRLYVQPVRENSTKIAALEARATQTAEQFNLQIADLQERITALEVQNDTDKETLAALETQLAAIEELQTTQQTLSQRLDELAAALATLEQALADTQSDQQAALDDLSDAVTANQAALAAIQQELAQEDFPAEQVYLELQLVKAMALLTRSQVFIFQQNLGLAQQDVTAARELVAGISALPLESEAVDLPQILMRLDLALGNLPDQPDQASADIQVAWDLLVAGVSGLGAAAADAGPPPPPTATPSP